MHLKSTARRIVSRIAIFAILLGSVAPALSQLLSVGGSAGQVEVCSALGSKWVSIGATESSGSAPAPTPMQVLEHCPYCSLQAHSIGMPPQALAAPPLPRLSFEAPKSPCAAPTARFAWVAAQPRAPPLFF